MRRTGVCGATETLLIDAAIAPALLPLLVADLRALGCDFRADARARAIVPDLPAADAEDFDTEWLDAVLSVAVVDGVDARGRAYRAPRQRAHRRDRHRGRGRRASDSSTASTARSACGTPPRSSATAANSASAPRSASPPGASMRAGRSALEQLTTYRYLVTGTGQVRP